MATHSWDLEGRTFPIRKTGQHDFRERIFTNSSHKAWIAAKHANDHPQTTHHIAKQNPSNVSSLSSKELCSMRSHGRPKKLKRPNSVSIIEPRQILDSDGNPVTKRRVGRPRLARPVENELIVSVASNLKSESIIPMRTDVDTFNHDRHEEQLSVADY